MVGDEGYVVGVDAGVVAVGVGAGVEAVGAGADADVADGDDGCGDDDCCDGGHRRRGSLQLLFHYHRYHDCAS